jgi:hypothetical protein
LEQAYIDKMPTGHPSITTRLTKKGKRVPHLEPWAGENYVAPELSLLGQKLLGVMDWERSGVKRQRDF